MHNTLVKAKAAAVSHKRSLMGGTAAFVVASVVAVASGIASATPYDPTTPLTTFASSVTSTAAPIILALAGALIALAVVFWGVRWVFGFLRGRGGAR